MKDGLGWATTGKGVYTSHQATLPGASGFFMLVSTLAS